MTRDLFVALGCAFLFGVAVGVEYMNYAAKQVNPDRGLNTDIKPASAAPQCLSTRERLPLRVAITHCPDGTPGARWCYTECSYGNVTRGDIL